VVVTMSEIISEIWGRSTCTDHLVHKAIAELRSALSDKSSAPRYIKTVPKRGYAMIAAVSIVDETVAVVPEEIVPDETLLDVGCLSLNSDSVEVYSQFSDTESGDHAKNANFSRLNQNIKSKRFFGSPGVRCLRTIF